MQSQHSGGGSERIDVNPRPAWATGWVRPLSQQLEQGILKLSTLVHTCHLRAPEAKEKSLYFRSDSRPAWLQSASCLIRYTHQTKMCAALISWAVLWPAHTHASHTNNKEKLKFFWGNQKTKQKENEKKKWRGWALTAETSCFTGNVKLTDRSAPLHWA